MILHSTPAACSQRIVASAPPTNEAASAIVITLRNLALLTVATLLGAVAVLTGWTYGYERSGTTLGALVGLAAAIGCLIAPALLTSAMRTWNVGRACAAALLLATCAPFALSGALGQAAAGRQQAADEQSRAGEGRLRAQEARARALAALATLPITRPAAELQSDIRRLLTSRRDLGDCEGWLPSSGARAVCIDVSALRSELARAEARTKHLEAVERADAVLASGGAQRQASADAVALSRFAGRLGVHVSTDLVADLLTVLAVVLVELGGGIALGLVDWSPVSAPRLRAQRASLMAAAKPLRTNAVPAVLALAPPSVPVMDQRRDAIVERLRSGALEGRQADLARELGVPKTTLRRIVERDTVLRLTPMAGGVSRLEVVG